MAYLYCKDCGEPLVEFHSIIDLTEELIAKTKKPHASICPGKKLTTKPGNLYFNLGDILRNNFT